MSYLRYVRNQRIATSIVAELIGEQKANTFGRIASVGPLADIASGWNSPKWCSVVNRLGNDKVTAIKGDAKRMKAESAATIRASISFPPEMYETLEVIAKEKKVSLAWVVREAAERYIAEKWPLFSKRT